MSQPIMDILAALAASRGGVNYPSSLARMLRIKPMAVGGYMDRMRYADFIREASVPAAFNKDPFRHRKFWKITAHGRRALDAWKVLGKKTRRLSAQEPIK